METKLHLKMILGTIGNFCDKKLVSLDLSNCPSIEHLHCSHNQLISLDLCNCPNLKKIFCHKNKLTSLDLFNCPNLIELYCSNIELIGGEAEYTFLFL